MHSDDSWDDVEIAITASERSNGMWCHLGGFLTGFLIPLIFYLVLKDSAFVRWHARQALNYQITILIPYAASTLAMCLFFITPYALFGGLIFLGLTGLYELVICILAAIAAYRGEWYQCPLTIPFFG